MLNSEKVITDIDISNTLASLFSEGSCKLAYSRPIAALEVPGVSQFYGIHLAIWQLREQDLQQHFPLNTAAQRMRYLAWCAVHGPHEYAALRELEPFWAELAEPANVVPTQWSAGISRLLQLLVLGRPDLNIAEDLASEESQEEALQWFFCRGGYRELEATVRPQATWQRRFFIGNRALEESMFARLIYKARPDVRQAFDITTQEGYAGFKQWLVSHAISESALGAILKPYQRAWPVQAASPKNAGFGVNLIGYAFGELGIGEDVRMAARALKAANVPFTIVNVQPGKEIRQSDRSVEAWVSEEPLYRINMVCLTALEHLRIYLEKGEQWFQGRYTIGYWPWELHKWPKKWKHCFNLADEVWASSKHIERAAKEASSVLVRYMPMAVTTPEKDQDRQAVRKKFGLPEKTTLFVFSFDGNSHLPRKNPSGIVKAFNMAFPKKTADVGLVIKCMRPDKNNAQWKAILKQAQKDSRLIIIDEMLSKEDVINLYGCCDCFVSLHRAEGFGRGIAEAILLGLDVVTTNYGGNTEFCRAAGAKLVDFKMIPVGNGDYVEWEDNLWAEPDLNAAAAHMAAVHKNITIDKTSHDREPLLHALFSPEEIGTKYRQLLERIADILDA